jgi:hypothetical protein
MFTRVRLCLGCTLLVAVLAAAAQDAAPEQTRLLAKRAAEADAYRKLAEVVYGLQLNSQTYVRDFVAESDDIRGTVDTFIKGIRLGEPTYFEDGSCEIPAEVTVAKVVETLRDAHDRWYKGEDLKAKDFESITKRIDKDVLRVVGTGAPRADLPPNLPAPAVERLGPPPAGAARQRVPAIWQRIPPGERMSAARAARIDAMRKLAERIKGLRLTSHTQVRDFVAESDEIRTELNDHLAGAIEVGAPYFHDDELIVEVTLRLPTEQVISTIKRLHSLKYEEDDADDIKGHDIEKIVKTVVTKEFEATGAGIPRPRVIRQYNEVAATPVPEWAIGLLESKGRGTDPAFDTPQGRLKAARAAELDAKRKLGEVIDAQRMKSDQFVRDFVNDHEELIAVMDGLLANAAVAKTEYDAAAKTATVTVTVPGMEVWGLLNDAIRRARAPRATAEVDAPQATNQSQ